MTLLSDMQNKAKPSQDREDEVEDDGLEETAPAFEGILRDEETDL